MDISIRKPLEIEPAARISTTAATLLLTRRRWRSFEIWVAAALTVFVIILHIRHFTRAGPLWRDEISTVGIANSPTWNEVYHNKVNDSAPMLWDGMIRFWTWTGLGQSDLELRLLALIVTIGVIGALWLNARLFGVPSPIISLTVLGLNGQSICYGDSLRAYGMGMLTGLLCTATMFYLCRASGRRQIRVGALLLAVTALATTHTNFLDTAWLLAVSLGGVAVCAFHRRWGRMLIIFIIGIVCAASLSIYAPVMHARGSMGQMFVYNRSFSRMFSGLLMSLGPSLQDAGGSFDDHTLSLAIGAVVVIACVFFFFQRQSRSSADYWKRQETITFCAVALLTGSVAYLGILLALGDGMVCFRFVVLIALAATTMDGLLASVVLPRFRLIITVAICAVTAIWAHDAWESAGIRLSDIDLVAHRLEALAQPGDLILVDPWWMGPSFARYYHGPGTATSFPAIPDTRFNRFDLIVPLLDDPHAVDPVLAQLTLTAKAGHRVWIVMCAGLSLALQKPNSAWRDMDRFSLWNQQLTRSLIRNFGVSQVKVLSVAGGEHVTSQEHMLLLVAPR